MVRSPFLGVVLAAAVLVLPAVDVRGEAGFDHDYRAYARLLHLNVRDGSVDYAQMKAGRHELDQVVGLFDNVSARDVEGWTRPQQIAFWINAYNVFTLRAIIDHYPIEGAWFSLQPRNSIRQIDGVWTRLTWKAAGRTVTLDDIEHRILRPVFREPLVHFAVNCASVSCPPLADAPYRAAALDAQLDAAARRYLANPLGLRVRESQLSVSSIFKWYVEDFVERYAGSAPASRPPTERAILNVIGTYGPPDSMAIAEHGQAGISFLPYDWSLNDTATR